MTVMEWPLEEEKAFNPFPKKSKPAATHD